MLILTLELFRPFPASAFDNCTFDTKWIDGIQRYSHPCACDAKIYPFIDAALQPFGAEERPVPSQGKKVNDLYFWTCGVTLAWRMRPDTISLCFERAAKARAALEEVWARMPESERPDIVGSHDLPCFGYETNVQGSGVSEAVAEVTTQSRIASAKQRLLDESTDSQHWDEAWGDLKKLIDPGRELPLSVLIERLKIDQPAVRRNAAHVIGLFGKNAHEASPDLLKAINDSDPDVRAEALRALGAANAGDGSVVSSLKRRLNDANDAIVEGAAAGLAAVGAPAVSAITELELVMQAPRRNVRARDAAREALRSIGTPEALLAVQRAAPPGH